MVISNRLNYLNDEDFHNVEKELEHVQNMIVKLKMSLNIDT
jgi:flagellin-specific chaperone FliS